MKGPWPKTVKYYKTYTAYKGIPATIMLKPNNVVNERRLKFALTVKIFRCSFPFYIQRSICYTDYKTVRPSDWLKTVIKA